MLDNRLILTILRGNLPLVIRWEAIYVALCNSSKFSTAEYVGAIRPYLYNENHNVRLLTIDALLSEYAGRKILREYVENLRNGGTQISLWPHEISSIDKSLETFNEEDARREKRRHATQSDSS